MSKKRKYILRVNGKLIPVNRDCYKLYYKVRRREKYLLESDEIHGKVSYHALDTEDYTGEEIIPDSSDSVEDTVVRKLMLEKLRKCLSLLPEDERSLILQIHAEDKSCRKIAFDAGIPQRTMNDRKNRILQKLRKLLEN